MIDIIQQISQVLLDNLINNTVIGSFMQSYRGNSTSGLIEWKAAMPREVDGRFDVNDTDTPYLRVCRAGTGFIFQPDPSFKADITVMRRILGVISSGGMTTYEGDEELKGLYIAVWRALFDGTMQNALMALGVKQTRVVSTDVDGLSIDPHAAFVMDIAFTVDGQRFMV